MSRTALDVFVFGQNQASTAVLHEVTGPSKVVSIAQLNVRLHLFMALIS